MNHEITIQVVSTDGMTGFAQADCSCGHWSIMQRFVRPAGAQVAARLVAARGKLEHLANLHQVIITDLPYRDGMGGLVSAGCACGEWGVIQDYDTDSTRPKAEQMVRDQHPNHLKEAKTA